MAEDDEAARKSRADKLREQISRLKNRGDAGNEEETAQPGHAHPAKSPRDFIEERMRELAEEEKRPHEPEE
jgi:hypothetical protein